jgi:prophage DNA circulation protein
MNIETETGSLDGIDLEMVDISDHSESSIVRYEYPYVDGADLENMGLKAGTCKIRCYFYDNEAQSTYNDHIILLNKLKGCGEHELLHPIYGVMKGMVDSVDVRKDDRQRCAEIDISFVKRGIDAIQPSVADTVDAAQEGAFSAGVTEQLAELAADLSGSALDLHVNLDPGKTLLQQASGISSQARAFARQIDKALAGLSAYANGVTDPLNSLTATLTYAANIPGRILGIADHCVERVARLYDGLAKFPARLHASIQFGLAKLTTDLDSMLPADRVGAKAVLLKHVAIAASRRLALETGYIYAADQDARRAQKAQGTTAPFDALGRYTPAAALDAVPMNVLELEDTLADTRALLQVSIDTARGMQSLKEMAQALTDSVSGVKLGAEQLVTVTIPSATPLHLICLQYGLPYSDAERIMALNPDLRDPSFCIGDLLIYRAAV